MYKRERIYGKLECGGVIADSERIYNPTTWIVEIFSNLNESAAFFLHYIQNGNWFLTFLCSLCHFSEKYLFVGFGEKLSPVDRQLGILLVVEVECE